MGDLPRPGTEPMFPSLAGITKLPGKPKMNSWLTESIIVFEGYI